MIFGGGTVFSLTYDDTWIYDLSDNSWVQQFPLQHPSSRSHAAIAGAGSGKVLLFGGSIGNSDPIVFNDETWLFEYSSNETIEVAVDVKPGGCPNQIRGSGNGKVNVSILGSSGFDVSRINPESVRLAGVAPVRFSMSDEAAPFFPFTGKSDCNTDCLEGGPDLFPDLNLRFEKEQLIEALGSVASGDCTVLHLTGELFDGTPIQGEDVVIFSLR
jgi:hypothetical protein